MKCRDLKVSNGCMVGAFTTAPIAMVSSIGTNLSRFMVRAIKVPVWLS
jgi:hypothetical protein